MSSPEEKPVPKEENKRNAVIQNNNTDVITLRTIYNELANRGRLVHHLYREKITDYKAFFQHNIKSVTNPDLLNSELKLVNIFWGFIQFFVRRFYMYDGIVHTHKEVSYKMFKRELKKHLIITGDVEVPKKIKKKPITKVFKNRNILICNTPGKGEFKLFINSSPITLKNLRIRENAPYLHCSEGPEPEWNHPAFPVKTLINWPYVAFQLILPEVVFNHNVDNIYKRFLYLKNAKREETAKNEHDLDVSIAGNVDYQSLKTVSADLLKNYLAVIRRIVLQLPNFTERRKTEVSVILDAVINDIELTKAQCLYIDLECVYALNKYDYYRKYNTDPEVLIQGSAEDQQEETEIKETVTPQVKFVLKRSSLENDNIDAGFNNVIKYFDSIFGHNKESISKFYETMKKCIHYFCILCEKKFEGVLASYSLEDHIKVYHGSESNWSCANCHKSYDPCLLSSENWKHTCQTTTQN